jgi:hypothetical protein
MSDSTEPLDLDSEAERLRGVLRDLLRRFEERGDEITQLRSERSQRLAGCQCLCHVEVRRTERGVALDLPPFRQEHG